MLSATATLARSNASELPARMATGSAITAILALAALHTLSPEFDPSWRMVSEYANGHYGWVLSLMFLAWALSSWALAFALWPEVRNVAGKIGLCLLVVSGIGEAMAGVFDINHHPGHDLAGALGVPTMAVAATLISVSLGRLQPWSAARRLLLWTSNLVWLSLLLLVATMIVFVVTLHHAGAHMSGHMTQLPPGVIALDGWANRMYVVTSCVWLILAASPRPIKKSLT
ncbi:MAG TPA: DUF998 domain-containing protein [Terriglobales bacterium]|jgi:hypothetical membrane protein|nr:DUF998 domain-containing protein [Terriglobales bacterium]